MKNAKGMKRKVLHEKEETADNDDYRVHSEEDRSNSENEENFVSPESLQSLETVPSLEEFILVEFQTKNHKVYYVAKVLNEDRSDVEVSSLRKSYKIMNTFHMPNVLNIAMFF
ncbi:hypothetical protein JTB14_012714 [Gonioctena quinquepunctata]|nr:hypothetical protein JTB14_012714 [Gonioctena quinquepunctata]